MKNQILIAFLFASLLMPISTLATPGTFKDVQPTDQSYAAIEYLYNANIIHGYQDGTFRPQEKINRAELLKILIESVLNESNLENYLNCFPDVQSQWFAPYVCYAKSQKWVTGFGDGTFKPAQAVTNAESLKIILLAQNIEITENPNGNWFEPYFQKAKQLGYLNEDTTDELANIAINRENIAQIIYLSLLNQTIIKEPIEDDQNDNDNSENEVIEEDQVIIDDDYDLDNEPLKIEIIYPPKPQLLVENARDQYIASFILKGVYEDISLESIAFDIENIDTTAIFHNTATDIPDDQNALKAIALYAGDGTPILNKNLNHAKSDNISDHQIIFNNLNITVKRMETISLLLYADINAIENTDIARSGMAFRINANRSGNFCKIRGLTSGNDYSCSTIVSDKSPYQNKPVYIFANQIHLQKTEIQPEYLYNKDNLDALNFNLIPANTKDVYLNKIQNISINCQGANVIITKTSLFSGDKLIGFTTGYNLCNSQITINVQEPELIYGQSQNFSIKHDVQNAENKDYIYTKLNFNGYFPGNDSICWEDSGTGNQDGQEICWINDFNNKDNIYLENMIKM